MPHRERAGERKTKLDHVWVPEAINRGIPWDDDDAAMPFHNRRCRGCGTLSSWAAAKAPCGRKVK